MGKIVENSKIGEKQIVNLLWNRTFAEAERYTDKINNSRSLNKILISIWILSIKALGTKIIIILK